MKTVKFRAKDSMDCSPKYRGVSDDDATKLLDAHSKGNHGPVRFTSHTMEVSIRPGDFIAVEAW